MHAQIVNAFVQEKVGSGFDIACSVYGSQIYRRFTNVAQLTTLVTALGLADSSDELIRERLSIFRDTFDYRFEPCSLNTDYELCLIDVNSGSDTKLMVKQVLDWAKAQ